LRIEKEDETFYMSAGNRRFAPASGFSDRSHNSTGPDAHGVVTQHKLDRSPHSLWRTLSTMVDIAVIRIKDLRKEAPEGIFFTE
jgi:hypothetical protein